MIHVKEQMKNIYTLEGVNSLSVLVTGKNKALLFDTGSGLDNLKEKVKEITDLPLIVIASHAHFDHIGGSYQFQKVYIDKKEFDVLKDYTREILNDWALELTGKPLPEGYIVPSESESIAALYFTSFDLGGLECFIIPLPGHTKGSLGIYIPKYSLLLSGDALLPVQTLNFSNHQTRKEATETLKDLRDLDFNFFLTAHQDRLYEKSLIEKIISCLENSKGKKFYDYKYPYPPHAPGFIYVDSLEGEPVAVIISEEEYNSKY